MKYIFVILSIAFLSCHSQKEQFRTYLDLDGQWQFALDSGNTGIMQKWYLSDLNDSILLPGTTDLYQKGYLNKDTTTMHLNRVYKYEGAAWYRKKVVIPESYRDKHVQLFIERTKSTKIWIDSTFVGESHLLQSPQQFDVPSYLSPGEHFITIQVNNDLKLTPYGNVHIYSDDTQTNWNGIIGKLYLEASSKTFISNLQVYPDIVKQIAEVRLEIDNRLNSDKLNIELLVEKTIDGKTTRLKSQKSTIDFQPIIKLEYLFEGSCSLWDEYVQPIYHLTAIISDGKVKDAKTVSFGMRRFSAEGTQFAINGRTTFLRGKHDAAVFPLTGFPPMEVEAWEKIFRIAKSYGINHYRFHSYCPPEAAFIAADNEGIFIQAELPFWGGLESDTIAQMLREEGFAMLKAYANHPSFVMFSPGNEIWSGHDRVEQNIIALKAYDNRPLYTMGSNYNIGYAGPRKCSDFFVGARTPYAYDTILTHTRLTHAFADSKDGGMLNSLIPSTEVNFDYAVSQLNIPIVSHEIGQYQIYPDYNEIEKYTGVMRAWNLEVFKKRLDKSGMGGMDSIFQKASGAWAAICYKAEMEAALRTGKLAGFQLLDLQDFPGQGTALVGILDAFMDSKNVVSPEVWKQSCNDVVLLLEFPKYCWTNNEDFCAKAVVANYSNCPIQSELHWEIRKQDGTVLCKETIPDLKIKNGGNTTAGEIRAKLSSNKKSEKLTVVVAIPGTEYKNEYPIWVYPLQNTVEIPADIIVSEKLNSKLLAQLQKGAKVLLFPQASDLRNNSIPGHFPPEFWNYGMFKGISEWAKKPVSPGTLGILTHADHPIFYSFPTDDYTNWQWFSIIKSSNPLILDNLPKKYFPIVQVIDNLERNLKLGLIFEFKVDKGKLLVCMSQLNQIMDNPEAVQLYQSIINYMESESFNPEYEAGPDAINSLLAKQ